MIDDRTVLRGVLDPADVRAWSPTSNAFGWRSYLGSLATGFDAVLSLAAPARAQDLAGLPPAWIGVGTLDVFHDEDLAYAARPEQAGVPCALTVVPGAFHGFDILVPWAGVSREVVATQVDALGAALRV